MNAISNEHMRKTMECYVDDIKGDHITDLKAIFDIMRAHS